MTLFEDAKSWADQGFCVVPPRQDGTKAPLGEWKQYIQQAPSFDQIRAWYSSEQRTGIGLVCGRVSGNLEMLELEGRATDGDSLDKIWEACGVLGVQHVWTELCDNYMERTPSGGVHFLYRISEGDATVPGNTKIARRPATEQELADNPLDKIKTLSETRGEGGYVVIAPSHGNVHPSGESWDLLSGQPGTVATLRWEDRCLLHQAIHLALDEMPVPEPEERKPQRPIIPGEKRPGDAFNEQTTWSDILLPLGWTFVYKKGDKRFWRRPGKDGPGVSATTSDTTDRLWVFSSSTEFEPEKHYSRFEAYALLEHHGNFSAAASELARRGLGTRSNSYTTGVLATAEPPVPGQPGMAVAQETPSTVATTSPTSITQWDRNGIPVYTPEVFKYVRRWNQCDFADMWAQLHENTFRYVGSEKSWLRWNGKVWERSEGDRHVTAASAMAQRLFEYAKTAEDRDPDVGKAMVREAKKMATSTGVNGIVSLGKANPLISATWEDFNKERHLVTVDNGILDLNTFELTPHDHAKMMTRKLNASYDPDRKEGRFTRFMEEVLPDQQVREYLQRICGYAMTGQADERVLVQLYGPSGTGKSQFVKAIFRVMGDFSRRASESAFQARPASYKGPSEDLHSLRGSRFAMLPELDEGFRLNVSLLKALTGGDEMTTRQLYGQEVTWRPEFTTFMITNHLPRVNPGEAAYWNRVKPIRFGETFVDENGETLSGTEQNLGEYMAQEEPEVILNWLLEGLKQYRERGLDTPEQISQWRDEYRDEVDTVRQFLREAPDEGRIEVNEEANVTVRLLHRAYTAWCHDNEIPVVGMRKFNERMDAAGFKRHRQAKGVTWDGIGIVGFIGEATTSTVLPTYTSSGRWRQ